MEPKEARYDRRMMALPLRLLLATLAGWVNRHQQHVIDYLVEENRALREQLRGRRFQLSDEQRWRLATKGQRLGRRVLQRVATIVTPDTILRWYRRLIAQKWTSECRRPGRPGVLKEIAALIVRMATENPAWGYSRIQGALKNLDHRVARSTVGRVLKDNGIPVVRQSRVRLAWRPAVPFGQTQDAETDRR